jgi:hypothetical protein
MTSTHSNKKKNHTPHPLSIKENIGGGVGGWWLERGYFALEGLTAKL